MLQSLAYLLLSLQLSVNPAAASDSTMLKGVQAFSIDQYDNLYLLQFNEVIKLDPERRKIAHYSNPLLGSISSLSIFDPLEPLLFYRDQQRIVLLDNRLAEYKNIALSQSGLRDVSLVSQSDDSHLWCYDQASNRIYRLNIQEAEVSHKSLPLIQILRSEGRPLQMESNINRIYLNIPEMGIAVFDAQAALLKVLDLPNVSFFHVAGDHLLFVADNNLSVCHLKSGSVKLLLNNVGDVSSMALQEKRLMLFSPPWLKIYEAFKVE